MEKQLRKKISEIKSFFFFKKVNKNQQTFSQTDKEKKKRFRVLTSEMKVGTLLLILQKHKGLQDTTISNCTPKNWIT